MSTLWQAGVTSLIVSAIITGAYLLGERNGRTARAGATPGTLTACTGPHAPRHMPQLVSRRRLRDGFRRSYWVRCWECRLDLGPFTLAFARFVVADLDGGAYA